VKGFGWSHKRVCRIYRELELKLRIKPKKRLLREKPATLTVPLSINQVWSMDFMHDQLSNGRSIRLFNAIDDFNREALGIDVDFSLPSERVIHSLDYSRSLPGAEVLASSGATTAPSTSVLLCRTGPPNVVNGNLKLIQFFRHRQLNIDTPIRSVIDFADCIQSAITSIFVDAFFIITPARRLSRSR
jgi:transposase InsO family protein